MPNNLCIVKESKLENGMIAIEMHTPLLRVVVLPAKGADIHSIQYKKREAFVESPLGCERAGNEQASQRGLQAAMAGCLSWRLAAHVSECGE